MVIIRQMLPKDPPWMKQGFTIGMGWAKSDGRFDFYLREHQTGKRTVLVAEEDGAYLGHCVVVWQPNYPYYRENNIPEIQDLNVIRSHRRQGIATQLVDEAERIVAQKTNRIGIGVGLYKDYGAAQRMYVQRGYIPDGLGISYNDEIPDAGTSLPLDDNLVLHLIKDLS